MNPFNPTNPFNQNPSFNPPFNNSFPNPPFNGSFPNPYGSVIDPAAATQQFPNQQQFPSSLSSFPMNGQTTMKDAGVMGPFCEQINKLIFEFEEDAKDVDILIGKNEDMLRDLNDQLQPVLTHSRQIEAVLAADQDVLEGVQEKLDGEQRSIQGVVAMIGEMENMTNETGAGTEVGSVGGIVYHDHLLERMSLQSKRFFSDLTKTFESKMRLLETEIKAIQHTLNTPTVSAVALPLPSLETNPSEIAHTLNRLEAHTENVQAGVEAVQAAFNDEKREFIKFLKENNLDNTDLATIVKNSLPRPL